MDLSGSEKKVTFFQSNTNGGGIWGRGGASIAPSGVIYAETGDGAVDFTAGKYADSVLALTPKELKLADYFTPSNLHLLDPQGSRHGQQHSCRLFL